MSCYKSCSVVYEYLMNKRVYYPHTFCIYTETQELSKKSTQNLNNRCVQWLTAPLLFVAVKQNVSLLQIMYFAMNSDNWNGGSLVTNIFCI